MYNWWKEGNSRMWIIAKLTYQEITHKRVFHLVLLLTVGFLLLYGVGLHYAYQDLPNEGEIAKIITTEFISIGLYLGTFITAFLTIMGSAGIISAEVESGIIQTILVKPLKRWEIIIGKYLGLSIMLVIYGICLYGAVLGLNYCFGKEFYFLYKWNTLKALGLYLSIPLVLASLTLWGSTFLPTLNNSVMVIILYSMSVIGGFIERAGSFMDKTALINIGIISSLLMPVEALYRKMLNVLFRSAPGQFTIFWDSLFSGKYEPSKWMLVFTVFYIIFFLWRSISVFSRKDI